MSRPDSELERIRAHVDGELADAGDVDADLLADYDLVHRLSASLEAPPEVPALRCPRPTTRRRRRPVPVSRYAVAAAVVVALVGGGLAYVLRPPTLAGLPVVASAPALRQAPPAEVLLAHIPLTIDPPSERALPIVAGIERYEVVVAGKVHWMRNVKMARYVSTLTGRPLIAVFFHPKDPRINGLLKGPLGDARVVRQLGRGVPVIYPSKTPAFYELGPHVYVYSPTGQTLAARCCTTMDAAAIAKLIDQALDGVGEGVSMSTIARAVGELGKAKAAEREERWGDAWRHYAAVLALKSPLDVNARLGQHRVRAAAHWRLLELRVDEDHEALGLARQRFAGTPFGADFDAIAEAIRQRGRFPRLRDR